MIICSRCNKTLDPSDPTKVEKKMCINCVRIVTPAADMNKLVDQHGDEIKSQVQQDKQSNGIRSKEDLDNFLAKFKSMELSHKYEIIDGEIRLVLTILDYYKKDFMSFAFNKHQLQDFITDIETIEKEAPV